MIFLTSQELLEKLLVLAPKVIHAYGDQLDALLPHAAFPNLFQTVCFPLLEILGTENSALDEIINGEYQSEIALISVQIPYSLQLLECLT